MNSIASNSYSFSSLHQISESGMTASRKRVEEAALNVSKGDLSAKNIVDMRVNERNFEANAQVLKTADEMTGTLLNVLA